jgi:hypothetical protein
MQQNSDAHGRCDDELKTFVRNRYFYGKLLDVRHFESEQSYFNEKRWLINRMIHGFGVVCGLDVTLSDDKKKLYVEPGLALDQAGHELVVPIRSKSIAVPELPPSEREADSGETPSEKQWSEDCDDERQCFHLCIEWHECETEPELVRVGNACEGELAPCSSGSIRERYRLLLREGRAPRVDWWCDAGELFNGGRLNYDALARYVTESCPKIPRYPRIALADVCLKPMEGDCSVEVDITVRPIVYTNDLLFELLTSMASGAPNRPRGGKY